MARRFALKRLFLIPVAAITLSCVADQPPPAAPFVAPSPVVTVAATEVVPGLARITWDVQHGSGHSFQVHRRLADKPWKNMFTVAPNVEGDMVLEDPSVQPGQRYTYRVRPAAAPDAPFQGEVAIVVPVM